MASVILGEGAPTCLFLHYWSDPDDAPTGKYFQQPWIKEANIALDDSRVFAATPEGESVRVVPGLITWRRGAWDALLADVADDKCASVVMLNPTSGELYAPYDGGADVIAASNEHRDALHARWTSWVSPRTDGL